MYLKKESCLYCYCRTLMVNGTVRVFDQIARRKHERYTVQCTQHHLSSHCFVVYEGATWWGVGGWGGGYTSLLKSDKKLWYNPVSQSLSDSNIIFGLSLKSCILRKGRIPYLWLLVALFLFIVNMQQTNSSSSHLFLPLSLSKHYFFIVDRARRRGRSLHSDKMIVFKVLNFFLIYHCLLYKSHKDKMNGAA
jgi:hypothetical protein